MDIHEANSREWSKILDLVYRINPKLKSHPIAIFYTSFKYWKKIDESETMQLDSLEGHPSFYVVSSLTKHYYILSNAE